MDTFEKLDGIEKFLENQNLPQQLTQKLIKNSE